jgi:hypothetical protein
MRTDRIPIATISSMRENPREKLEGRDGFIASKLTHGWKLRPIFTTMVW